MDISSVDAAAQDVLITRDGRETPVYRKGAPIIDEQENLIGVVLTFRDITERKRMEKAREQSLRYEQEARREAEVARRLEARGSQPVEGRIPGDGLARVAHAAQPHARSG